jgi:uncharacterized membrane protein YGL010W
LIAALSSRSRDAPTWKLLALINFLFPIEIICGFRFLIHGLATTMLQTEGLYARMHGGIQEIINILIAIIALIFVTLLLFRRQVAGGAARVAVSITIVVVALFAIETVSLHALRAVIYQPIGPVLMIGWLWAIAAAGVCLAAVRCAYRSHT